ncbi:MAG: hypothetical protein ACE5OQ_03040 [Woeseia sp.]
MKRLICLTLAALFFSAFMAACGGGGGGAAPPPPPPPPPPTAQNPGGIWVGQSVTAAAPDVFTSFEITQNAPFTVGTAPFTASFSNGRAETRGVPSFYITGANAWHVLVGTSATVTFGTNPSSLNFWVRTENAGDVAEVRIVDENSTLIQAIVPDNVYREITINRMPGEPLIGSVEVTSTSGGDVVIDDFTFGFAAATDDVDCAVAETLEFACVVSDTVSGAVIASAGGMVQISNGNQVSGTGTLHAVPGFTLSDGSTVAALTISAGTVSEGNTLDLTISAAGTTVTISATFDNIYNRGSDLATVAAVYTTFDIFGDPSSFTVDATGAITGQSNAGCVLNGQVTIIDAAFNAYDVALDVANCGGLDGMYNGLGLTRDNVAMDDLFEFAVFTAQTTIVGAAEK